MKRLADSERDGPVQGPSAGDAVGDSAKGPTANCGALMGLRRGVSGRCPNCGTGRLFRAYLKVHTRCKVCGHDNGQYPADDAPSYFTILIVGHLVIGPVLAFDVIFVWPALLLLAVLLPSLSILSLLVLPIVKGAVIGVLWGVAKPEREPQ